MSTLVTGGAGYIGSHVIRLLRGRGDAVVAVDDLSTGLVDRLEGVPLVELDLSSGGSAAALLDVIRAHDVDSVVHFAAHKRVDESVARPTWYFERNIGSLAAVLHAIEVAGVERLVFSSSAAVYGEPSGTSVSEDEPCAPVNPYGQSKLVGEWMTRNAAVATGLRIANLRYFNVAGAGWEDLRDRGATNLVPLVVQAALEGRPPKVFGDRHATKDGSCVRDYVHVLDLAEAHLAALDHLADGRPRYSEFNVGTGVGSSVFDVVAAVARASGRSLEAEVVAPRSGDPAAVVADVSRAAHTLGWTASRGLDEIAGSAWAAASRPATRSEPTIA